MLSPPSGHSPGNEHQEALQLVDTLFKSVRAIQKALKKTVILAEHPNLPLHHQQLHPQDQVLALTTATIPSSTHSSFALITAPPFLSKRQVPTDCNSQVNQFKSQFSIQNSQQIASVSQQAAASISRAAVAQGSAQSSADAANSALQSIQTSASQALSSASASVSVASSNAAAASVGLSSAVASASSAIAFANASASSLAAIASASASSAIVSASASVSSALISVNSVVAAAQASASSNIEAAKATATFALTQAQAIVNSVNAQAAASVRASQVQAITATQAAIAVVVAIIGSSLLSILAYFLLTRYKRRKRAQNEQARDVEFKKEDISRPINNQSRNSSSNSEYGRQYAQPPSLFSFELPLQNSKKQFWSFGTAKDLGSNVKEEEKPRPSTSSRKTTLVYNPDFPEEPPKFESFDRDTYDVSTPSAPSTTNVVGNKIDFKKAGGEGKPADSGASEFLGFDGDFGGDVTRAEEDGRKREDDKSARRGTIGAAI